MPKMREGDLSKKVSFSVLGASSSASILPSYTCEVPLLSVKNCTFFEFSLQIPSSNTSTIFADNVRTSVPFSMSVPILEIGQNDAKQNELTTHGATTILLGDCRP